MKVGLSPAATGESVRTLFIQPHGNTRESRLGSDNCAAPCQVHRELLWWMSRGGGVFLLFLFLPFSFPLTWTVVSFIPPPHPHARIDLWSLSHTFICRNIHFPFPERRRTTPRCFPFMFWANFVVLFYGLELRAASALNTSPWPVRLMRKAKWLQVKGSGLCCGEKLGKKHHREH